jgi:uncharacterized protein YaiI (UPF0178 family)
MHIWLDADACPRVIKDVLFRTAERRRVLLTVVANTRFAIPQSQHIEFLTVASGFDQADQAIIDRVQPGDLVVTMDIPLASAVIDKGGLGLSPRGELFTPDNIRSRLTMRDFMDELRGSGVMTGGPAPLSAKDRQQFANQLDRLLTRQGC